MKMMILLSFNVSVVLVGRCSLQKYCVVKSPVLNVKELKLYGTKRMSKEYECRISFPSTLCHNVYEYTKLLCKEMSYPQNDLLLETILYFNLKLNDIYKDNGNEE